MLARAFGDNPVISEVFIFGSWAARYRDEGGAPPNDVDVAIVSDSLTRFDLAEVRLDLENESKLSINLFVFEADNERLPELRAGGVPVLERCRHESRRPASLDELRRNRMHQVAGSATDRAKAARSTLGQARDFRRVAVGNLAEGLGVAGNLRVARVRPSSRDGIGSIRWLPVLQHCWRPRGRRRLRLHHQARRPPPVRTARPTTRPTPPGQLPRGPHRAAAPARSSNTASWSTPNPRRLPRRSCRHTGSHRRPISEPVAG